MSKPLLGQLRQVWQRAQARFIEVGGHVHEGEVIVEFEGTDRMVAGSCHPAAFHTHPTGAIGGETLEVDRLSPPSGADYRARLTVAQALGAPATEYVVVELGVWEIGPAEDCPGAGDADAVEVYYQVLKYHFLSNGGPMFRSVLAGALWRIYARLATRLDVDAACSLLEKLPGHLDYVDDQFRRTYCGTPNLSAVGLRARLAHLDGKSFHRVRFHPFEAEG